MRASLAMLLCLMCVSAHAERPTIPDAYKNIANAIGVPDRLLYAIALQESKLSLRQNTLRPWPWTLNVKGSPQRLNNSQDTLNAIKQAKASGITNIDVGLMQVNLKYHGQRFESLSDAVDPYNNIWVGASILKEEYQRCHDDWWCAVGHYHSPTPKRAEHYRRSVRAIWRRLSEH